MMKTGLIAGGALVLALLVAPAAWGQTGNGSSGGWGDRVLGVDLSRGFASIAAGFFHILDLKANTSFVSWKLFGYAQANVPTPNKALATAAGRGCRAADREHSYGDLDCDGDVDAFILALTKPNAYHDKFPDCDIMNADCDGNGHLDAFDIDPFIT
jgi:hypothetical protein